MSIFRGGGPSGATSRLGRDGDGRVQEVGLQAAVYAGGCKVPGAVAHAQGRQHPPGVGDLDLPREDMPLENVVPLAGLPKQGRRPRAFAAEPEGDEAFM